MTLVDLKWFADFYEVPLMYNDTREENIPCEHIELVCFERHKQLLEDFLYKYKSAYMTHEIITVPDTAGNTQQELIKYNGL